MAFSKVFDTALVVAALAHRDQTRKGSPIPYVMHPFHVSMLLHRFGYGEPLTIAALLHDVLEDVRFDNPRLHRDFVRTFPQWHWPDADGVDVFRDALSAFLLATFGTEVVRLVRAVTEEKNQGGPEKRWIERKRQQLAHLATAAEDEAILKAADVLHNLSTMAEDIRIGRATLDNRFNATPAETLWYYGEVCRLVTERTRDAPIAKAAGSALADLWTVVDAR